MWIYLCVVNGIALWMMGHDKRQAMRGGRRVPESRLFLVAFIGGAAGILLGMRWFRHKTKRRTFRFGMPLILAANAAAVLAGARWFGSGG